MKSILFNTNMVRALLSGRKTVTRRVVKPQPRIVYHDGKLYEEDGTYFVLVEDRRGGLIQIVPPYRPGDILYVRETWAVNNITQHDPEYVYKADYDCTKKPYEHWKWRPYIHMPKEAARVFLRVTNVRVERLQDMTIEDAAKDFGLEESLIKAVGFAAFASIMWDITIKRKDRALYGWAANPWVWAIEFDRTNAENDETENH